ncbi:hypothetical protein WA026_005417 [Henosepilachna vigintioctopunctata]|uniref:CHK kinase-like domain-containing protein n=1 Tax=Henosepilachna vigintioctopunctata TaxID=420089 RepID=A0AAW1U1Q1_9CUCU
MSCATVMQDLRTFTNELMMKEGIEDYDLHIKGYSEKGENYLGDVTFFSVVSKESKKKYNLVMKTAKRSEELRKVMPVGMAYKRESFMYREIFPEMRKFLKSAGDIVSIDYVPKIYSLCDEEGRESLIMENLNDLGYRLSNRKKPMDLECVLLVLKTLGKYHAVSMAMREKSPKIFEDKAQHLTNIRLKFLESTDSEAYNTPLIENACKLLEQAGRQDLADKIDDKIKKQVLPLTCSLTSEEDKLVICHGDCWNNNIMFKYDGAEDVKPTGICFVDFQLSMFDSPIKDLSYFIYTACDKSSLDKFGHLLQVYYDSVCSTLEKLECKPEEYFTYQYLMDQWKKYGAYGLILSAMMVKVELLSGEEAPDIVEIAATGTDSVKAKNSVNLKIENEDEYNERILHVFTHFAETFL